MGVGANMIIFLS